MYDESLLRDYLVAGEYIDSDHPEVIRFARSVTDHIDEPRLQAVALYYVIRDRFQYNPYRLDLRPEALKASSLLTRDYGYCIEKANLLAATCRVLGIPARLGFANVRNHIGTARLEEFLQTDLLVFHGYCEIYLEGKWVKATPAFNRQLCALLGVPPLPFDGLSDSIFQQYTANGDCFMEYLHDYGQFADVPRELFLHELETHYPHIFRNPLPESRDFFIKI